MTTTQDPSAGSSVLDRHDVEALAQGLHGQPFSVLGQHRSAGGFVVRTLQPGADSVALIDETGSRQAMSRIHESGLFELQREDGAGRYQLALSIGETTREIVDPYALPSAIGEIDRHLFNEGTHQQLHELLGSHAMTHAGVDGVQFAVWAPNARRVSVVGPFNDWDARVHAMRAHPASGLWDIFIPELGDGTLYKLQLHGPDGQLLPLKHDPYARYFEQAPANASIVHVSSFEWTDAAYLEQRGVGDALARPMSLYEVHVGSWRRHDDDRSYSWNELADNLIPYLDENGFTHVELMPITEHPFTGSWGYQPIGLFAPTSRFGSPDAFRHFVDRCHAAGIGVIMDWVPAHFPTDEHGLGLFDGTHLYEHADPRQGMHQDWNTLIYNFGRREVCNYLLSNAVYWIREFHLDGLRVDAVASMLYLDYSRKEGEWIPNRHGGRENLEAIDFLRRMNDLVQAEGGITLAEESTSFPGVSRPTSEDGLGFTFKWNMGWMHDILSYMSEDPIHRQYHHNNLTFGLVYAFSENFLLPFSHDEVVYGKGSLINKMPGDEWQQFANLRACFGLMFCYPGKKLMFMGCELAQGSEWSHDGSVHWNLLDRPQHAGMLTLVRDLNMLYRNEPALHETDCDGNGFEWIDCQDAGQSVVSFYRYSKDRQRATITVCNFTPIVRRDYAVGVNTAGTYRELLNTDAERYGGSGQLNDELVVALDEPLHNRPASVALTLPPLGIVVLQAEES